MRRPRVVLVLTLALALVAVPALLPAVPPASAGERGWTLDEISRELMCPQCEMRLDLSTGAAAERVRVYVERRRAQGWTKAQVKEALVAEYGPRVLASPPRSGFGGLAWGVPAAILVGGVALTVAAIVLLRRRPAITRGAPAAVGGAGDAELERRLDDALRRFDP